MIPTPSGYYSTSGGSYLFLRLTIYLTVKIRRAAEKLGGKLRPQAGAWEREKTVPGRHAHLKDSPIALSIGYLPIILKFSIKL
jgi:hypothetical protein